MSVHVMNMRLYVYVGACACVCVCQCVHFTTTICYSFSAKSNPKPLNSSCMIQSIDTVHTVTSNNIKQLGHEPNRHTQ